MTWRSETTPPRGVLLYREACKLMSVRNPSEAGGSNYPVGSLSGGTVWPLLSNSIACLKWSAAKAWRRSRVRGSSPCSESQVAWAASFRKCSEFAIVAPARSRRRNSQPPEPINRFSAIIRSTAYLSGRRHFSFQTRLELLAVADQRFALAPLLRPGFGIDRQWSV